MKPLALSVLIATTVLAASSTGCRKGDAGPHARRQASTDREVSKDDLFKEQSRIAAGEDVGAPLRTPSVEISKDAVSINGIVVTDAVLPQGAPTPIEAIKTWLKREREHWKMLYPGSAFDGTATVKIEPSLSGVAGLAVLNTVGLAGYAQNVTAGDTRFSASVPASPSGGQAWLLLSNPLAPAVRFTGRCDHPLEEIPLKDPASLKRVIAEVCSASAFPCFLTLVVEPSTAGDFGTLGPWLAAGLDAGAQGSTKPGVAAAMNGKMLSPSVLTAESDDARSPCGKAFVLPPKLSCDTRFKSEVRVGAVTTTGGLDSAQIQGVVEGQRESLTACYHAARCSNPSLTGRIVVRFSVLSTGQTMALKDGGSDMPSADVVRCAISVLHRTRFPSSEKPTQVSVPVLFAPAR